MSTTEMMMWLLLFGLVALIIVVGEAISTWRYERKAKKNH